VLHAPPAPVPFKLIVPVFLFFPPAVAPPPEPVILSLHDALPISLVNVSRLFPVITRLPPQTPVVPLGADSPEGSVSVNATPVSATVAFAFANVTLTLVVCLMLLVTTPNALTIVGGPTTVTLPPFH